MGLLDDAIREHLELRLRRGADPAEVARQEKDALGPVRRQPGSESEPLAAEPAADFEAPTELAPPSSPPAYDFEASTDPAPPSPEPDYDFEAPTGLAPLPGEEPEADHEPAAGAQGQGGSVPAVGSGETEEWGFEETEEEDSEEPGEGEDVLEQTPEFLSETPEHDRLWFEQKPPRDFDFDG